MTNEPTPGSGSAAQPATMAATPRSLSDNHASTADLSWGTGFTSRQSVMGWSLLAICFLGIIWGSLPGNSWFPHQDTPLWEYAVALGVSLITRLLCGLVIYEYEGWQVGAALVANRKITPELADQTQANIRSIQKQGALENMFGGRQLILVSTVLFPTVVEAAFYPLLPSFDVAGSYLSGLAKVTVKTFAFAVLICILAQVSSQMKAIGGPIAWMQRRTTKYVITSVRFAEKLGLIIPSRLMADRLETHHELDGSPGTVHEWAGWWSEKIATDADGGKIPPPYLLPPDDASHIMPHQLLNFLLSRKDDPSFYEDVLPSFIYASVQGMDEDKANEYWAQMDQDTSGGSVGGLPSNHPFVWRTGADSLGHVPPHHMIMVLFSSYLLILQNNASPDQEVEELFTRFSDAAFGEADAFGDYWSNVRKFKIGSGAPLAAT